MFDPPSRLECRTIGGPAAPNAVQACSAQAIASEASNLALLSTLPSRQGLRGCRDGWPRVRMGATMASATLPPTAPTRGCTQICARTSRDQSERIRTTFPSRPLPFISGRPRAPSRKLDSLTRSDMSSAQLPLDDSSVSATINRKPWSRLQRALSQFWRNKWSPWVALPCSSNSTSSEPTNCCSDFSRSGTS